MVEHDDEDRLLRSVAIQNANAILLARQRAEQELVRAKEALELKTRELALKFTGKNGRIQVVLRRVNSHIEISVDDTGIGITPGFLPHVFDRFRQADASSTRAAGGLGLGLAIVKQLVELHGGTVRATSAGPDRGATFTIELPRMAIHDGSGERIHPTALATVRDFNRVDLAGVTVLVVDDEADARELITRVLAECGAHVVRAGSAEETLRAVEGFRPDVLVCVARSEDRTQALRAGFLMHVSKPVEPSELAAAVASVVGRTGDRA